MSANPVTGLTKGSREHCVHSWGVGRPLSEAEYLEQLRARFWRKVDKTPGQGPEGDCWEWKGSIASKQPRHNYGQLACRRNGVNGPARANIVSFYLHHGRWPAEGLLVCHTCDNPPCVRPDHLWEGTNAQNWRDSERKGRAAKPRVFREPKQKVLRIRFSPEQLAEIRAARKRKGASIYDIGQLLDLDFSFISYFESGKRCLPVEKAHALILYLGADVDITKAETFAHGNVGVRQGRKPRKRIEVAKISPTLPHQKRKLHSLWSRLPAPDLSLYRADLIREALMAQGAKITGLMRECKAQQPEIHAVLNGLPVRPVVFARVLQVAGLKADEVLQVARAA